MAVMARGRLYSVGYEGLTQSALVERLVQSRVTTLVDVRLNATSRQSGFSKRSLSEALTAAGIAYIHEPALGNPPENREWFRSGDVERGVRVMRKRLSNGSGSALQWLASAAHGSRVAVLCVEREPLRCHRHVVTEMAQELDPELEVFNIL
jgi:uncharacterized protein (DUF488 family)